jgi:hypothetical protein
MPQFGDALWQGIAGSELNPRNTEKRRTEATCPNHINSSRPMVEAIAGRAIVLYVIIAKWQWNMARKILHYFYRFIIKPAKATDEIAQDASGLWAGLWWVIIFCLCYSVTVLIFYLLGHTPVAEPFLTIPLEKWYLVQTFTTVPVGLAGFLSYSGLAYLLCRAAKGKGDFDQTFASQAFTVHIPTFIFMWIPETFLAPILIANGIQTLPWPDWAENLRIFVFPFIWIFVISTVALSRIHGIPRWKGLIISLVSFIPMGGIMAVFIR